jgi:hypothetical protein
MAYFERRWDEIYRRRTQIHDMISADSTVVDDDVWGHD